MLKETLPNLTRLAILFNPDVAATRSRLTSVTETARALGLATIPVEARGLDALKEAFAIMVREGAQAFVMQGDSVLFNHRSQIAEMALQNGLPAASIQKELAEAGFLLTYGADIGDLYRRGCSRGCHSISARTRAGGSCQGCSTQGNVAQGGWLALLPQRDPFHYWASNLITMEPEYRLFRRGYIRGTQILLKIIE